MKAMFALAAAILLCAPLAAQAGGHGRDCGCGAPEPSCGCDVCAKRANHCGCGGCKSLCLPKLNLPSLCDLFKCKKSCCQSCQPACEPEPVCAAQPACGCGHAKRCGLPSLGLLDFFKCKKGGCGCEAEASDCGCGEAVEGEVIEEAVPAAPGVPDAPDAEGDVPAPPMPKAESTRYQHRGNYRIEADHEDDASPSFPTSMRSSGYEHRPASVRTPSNMRSVRSTWPAN